MSFLYFHPHTFIINDVIFYWLQANLKCEDDTPVDRKGSGRKVIEKLQQIYAAELANKDFAYDCEKSLFTIGALPQVKMSSLSWLKTFQLESKPQLFLLICHYLLDDNYP